MDGPDVDMYVGAVWAEDRWLAVALGGANGVSATVCEDAGALWARYEDEAAWILVTVPIGLRESGGGERRCDQLAREALGPLADSVHRAPVRETVYKQRYRVGARVEERKTGRELSKAAWRLREPIKQVDSLLRNVPEARHVFVETHPEVCYRAFAGEPLTYDRGTAAAVAERLAVLTGFDPDAPPTVQQAALDTDGAPTGYGDVVDAAAAALTGRSGPGELRGLPDGEPPTDEESLPMRIAYRSDSTLG